LPFPQSDASSKRRIGGEEWQRISFRAESLKHEDLAAFKAVADPFHVAQLLAAAVLFSMLPTSASPETEVEKPLLCEANNEDELYEFVSGKFAARLNETHLLDFVSLS
jgi:hypothetical protein